ncbi:unnamed protein product [Ectocarpus sp. 8 AP-2014]
MLSDWAARSQYSRRNTSTPLQPLRCCGNTIIDQHRKLHVYLAGGVGGIRSSSARSAFRFKRRRTRPPPLLQETCNSGNSPRPFAALSCRTTPASTLRFT